MIKEDIKDIAVIFLIPLAIVVVISIWQKWYTRDQYISYEAYIEPADYTTLPIPCVAEVIKSGNSYKISELHFPFGHSRYFDDITLYDWDNAKNGGRVRTDENSYDVMITLGKEVSDSSFQSLDLLYERKYGEAYASKKSDVYHIHFSGIDCPGGQQIMQENCANFYDCRDAEIMGFRVCDWCREHW